MHRNYARAYLSYTRAVGWFDQIAHIGRRCQRDSACAYITGLIHTWTNALFFSRTHLSSQLADLTEFYISVYVVKGIMEAVLRTWVHRLDVGFEKFLFHARLEEKCLYVCVYVHVRKDTSMYVHVWRCMYILSTYTHAHAYKCTYIHTHTHTHTHTQAHHVYTYPFGGVTSHARVEKKYLYLCIKHTIKWKEKNLLKIQPLLTALCMQAIRSKQLCNIYIYWIIVKCQNAYHAHALCKHRSSYTVVHTGARTCM